jgi:flagellar motor switch protein FliN
MAENMKANADNAVRRIELTELEPTTGKGRTLIDENGELIKNIKVRLSVSVGKCELTVKDLLGLREESVLTLDRGTKDPVDIYLDGRLIARGHLVAVDDAFGVRISEIVSA